MSDRPPDRPEGRPRRLPPAPDSETRYSALLPEHPNRAIKTTKIFSQLTDPFIIAELVAASREQGRRELEAWLEGRP